MFRGTTPQISFKINSDIDLNNISKCYITFADKIGRIVNEYDISDVTIDAENDTITLNLSQEETLAFNSDKFQVQIRILMNDGKAYASEIKLISVNRVLKDGVI